MRVFDYKILHHIFTLHEEKFKPLLQDDLLLELYNKYSEAMHEALRSLKNHAAIPYKWFSDESLTQKVEALEETYKTSAKTVRPIGKNSEKYPDLVPVPQPPSEKTKTEKKPRQKRKKKELKSLTKKKIEKESKRPKLTESLPPPPPPPSPSEPSSSGVFMECLQPPVIEVLATGGPPPPSTQHQEQQPQASSLLIKDKEQEEEGMPKGNKEEEKENAMVRDIERQLQEFYDQMFAEMKNITIPDGH